MDLSKIIIPQCHIYAFIVQFYINTHILAVIFSPSLCIALICDQRYRPKLVMEHKYVILPANWRSRSVPVCFPYARKIVYLHKINFCVDVEHMVCFLYVFGCAPSVYILRSHIWVLGLCVFIWVNVVIEHMMNTKWFQISTSWTRKFPEHPWAPICWVWV